MQYLVMTNEFGDKFQWFVEAGDFTGIPVAANTVMANITADSAAPVGVTYAALAAKLPCAMLLTGLAAGTNTTILAADTLLVALAKLQAQIDAL